MTRVERTRGKSLKNAHKVIWNREILTKKKKESKTIIWNLLHKFKATSQIIQRQRMVGDERRKKFELTTKTRSCWGPGLETGYHWWGVCPLGRTATTARARTHFYTRGVESWTLNTDTLVSKHLHVISFTNEDLAVYPFHVLQRKCHYPTVTNHVVLRITIRSRLNLICSTLLFGLGQPIRNVP
jgi:hypothetical protein